MNSALKRVRGNLAVLAAMSFLRGAHNSIYGVIWQPFVLSLGASMPTLGLLNSLGGMGGIVPTLVQPLGGWFADRRGRKPFILLASLATIGGYGLFAIAGLLHVWVLLVLGVVLMGASALSRPAISSLTAESVRAGRHGSAFSLMIVAGMTPGIIMPVLGGWVADRYNYSVVFAFSLILEAATLFLVWRYLREARPSNGGSVSGREAVNALLHAIVPPKGLAGFFCACAADVFFWSIGWGLIYGMLTDTLHFSAEQLGLLAGVSSLSWAILQMPIGRYMDRHGTRWLMIFSEALGIPLMLVWMTQTRFEFFVASQVLFGLIGATWVPAVSTYLSRRVGDAERAETFGRLNAFRGLMAIPAPAIGGLLYAWGGMRVPLMANMLGIVVIIAILAFFVQEEKA